jgi:hypothetical protein
MTRKEELLEAVKNDPKVVPLINDMVYLENQLELLRALPKIKVDPERPDHQKATPAAKQYKEYLQQYVNVVKVVQKAAGDDGSEADSPLRAGLKKITGMTDEMEC